MHTLKVAQPRAELRRYVRLFAQRNTGNRDPFVVEPVPAQLEQILAFELGTPVEIWQPNGKIYKSGYTAVGGAQSQFAAHMHLPGGVISFGIFFQPTGCSELFAVPIFELTDTFFEATPVVGRFVRSLWNRLGEVSSLEERVHIAERFLLDRAARASTQNVIHALAEHLFRLQGAVRIADLARLGPWSLRQFERNFLRAMGVTPKSFARIARFQAALDAKIARPGRTWLDIAHSFGYHDQMHMIHDFEDLGRDTPTKLIAALGDIRPAASGLNAQEISH
ncbi:MAG: AraC family transcriptional regulator [Candidatus Acidiferrales bacterium]